VAKGPFHRFLGFTADYKLAQITESVPWITGACFMIPRVFFWQLGGLDENFKRGYFEDVDLCERVKEAGRSIWYCADVALIHEVGQSTQPKSSEEAFKATLQFNRNATLFHKKWDAKIKPDVASRMVSY